MYNLPIMSAVIGASLALSSWHFLRATLDRPAAFDADTLESQGILFTFVIFAFTGPVLVLEAVWPEEGDRSLFGRRVLALALFGIWSAALGTTILGLFTHLLQ